MSNIYDGYRYDYQVVLCCRAGDFPCAVGFADLPASASAQYGRTIRADDTSSSPPLP